jgi:hypothetical protein
MFQSRAALLLLILAVVVPSVVPGRLAHGDAGESMLYSWLDNVMQSVPTKIKPQKVIPIADADVLAVFPGDRFYGVYFATWPVAPKLPKELSFETVVRIRQGGSIEPIGSADALRNFLAQNLGNIRDDGQARTAALASLRLAEAGAKAGPSPFEQPSVAVVRQGNNLVATASSAVQAPGRGEVAIHLEFGADGKINPDALKIDDRTRRGPPS